MTLRTVAQADVADVFLQEDDFAEQFTYYPRGGGSKPVTGIVERTTNYGGDDLQLATFEEASVFVARDVSGTGGGIASPQIGDRVKFTDGKTFSYSGDVDDSDDDAWTLRYTREIPVQEGGTDQRLPTLGR